MEEQLPIFDPINMSNSFQFDEMGFSTINDTDSRLNNNYSISSAVNPEVKSNESQTKKIDTGIVTTPPEVPKAEKTVLPAQSTVINVNANIPNPEIKVDLPQDKSPLNLKPEEKQTFNVEKNESKNQMFIFSPEEFKLREDAKAKKIALDKIQSDFLARQFGINTQAETVNTRLEKLFGLGANPKTRIINTNTINTQSASENKESTSINENNDSIFIENSSTGAISSPSVSQSTVSSLNPTNTLATQNLVNKYFGTAIKLAEQKRLNSSSSNDVTSPENIEITKTTPTFNEKIPQSSEKIIEKSNSAVMEKTQTMLNQTAQNNVNSAKETSTELKEISQNSQSQVSAPLQDMPKPGPVFNFDGLEARLSRLEYLLSNPLEVKIIDQ